MQWAALPGNFEITHVHVPHYCAMFQRLFRGPRPHRFGHVYLPEGSKNLGNPEYALAPGTKVRRRTRMACPPRSLAPDTQLLTLSC